ncbi:MAG: aromatic ring-hydroxylating dioxygenase subunit alpha [Rubrivivax sp.]|nr:aromatic ring-hydroxylating dioxygenase subunit alpha [Rubrivivax sp.]
MNGLRFDIDPDVARARTIAKDFYLDESVYALARERLFARAWHWLGPLGEVAAPGALAPLTLLPGLLDEPLLLARDEAGTLRALSNVCTHRGMPLVDKPCRAKEIRCPYHSRRFGLDGRLRFMPGFEGARDFPTAADDLPRLALETIAGHAFVALDPALPFDDWSREWRERLSWLDLASFTADPSGAREFTFDAHWALYVENYLEGLHIPFLHPALNGTLAMDGYDYELGRASVLQLARARDGEPAFALPAGAREHGQRIAAYYWWLFPNLMLNFYPWGLSVNVVQPLGPARTRVIFRSFVADASRLGQGAGGALDTVELEDEAAVVAVQRGIRSRLYRDGRYSPRHEAGVHHFHRLLAAALAG